jgi:ATP-dependent DNA helicase PIF1
MEEIKFNKKQQEAYDKIIEGKSLFVTGSSGTGKSELIKRVTVELTKRYFKNIAITSTTGVSANIIGGRTLHSYLGIGLGTSSYKKLLSMIKERPMILARWRHLDILLIDEISLLSVELFEKLELLARTIRKNSNSFGGITLLLFGDFLQLPVVRSNTDDNQKLLFESPVFKKCITETIYLTQIMRQKDERFAYILNKIRMGEITDEVKEVLQSREIKYISKEGFIPTMLVSTNQEVDRINKKYYDKLIGTEYKYELRKKWYKNIAYKEKYDNLIRFEEELTLKENAQVVYLVNSPNNLNLYNGSRGVIKRFEGGLPVVLFTTNGKETFEEMISDSTLDIIEEDKVVLSYTQLPIKLAYCMTTHKAQGMSISLIRVILSKFFEFSQAYVALSRVRSLEGLYIRGLNTNLIKANPKCVAFYKALEAQESE